MRCSGLQKIVRGIRKQSHFGAFWPYVVSGHTVHHNLFEHAFLQAKTKKTKAKQAVISLFKHTKATNGSLNEVVVSAR